MKSFAKSKLKFLSIAVALLMVATGCGESKAQTNSFVNKPDVTALLGLPDGGLRFATKSGEIFDVSKTGEGTDSPIAKIDNSNNQGVLGLVYDNQQRTYASWVDAAGAFTIAQVFPGPLRTIFKSTEKSGEFPSGRLTLSKENRIYATFNAQGANGKVISVDPDRNDDQVANVVSAGDWNRTSGLAFAAGHVLWVADAGDDKTEDRLSRTRPEGPTEEAKSGRTRNPVALSHYGDTELVVCYADNGDLRRYMINDGVRTLKGRQLANDCASDVAQLHDGRLAYATKTDIRVTAL